MTSLLTWKRGLHTHSATAADGTELFVITWRSRREEPSWQMRCRLPGLSGEWKHDDMDELQRQADVILATWLGKITGLLAAKHAEYSLSGQDAYTVLTGEYDLSMTGANSLIFLAAAFGETRIPFRGSVLAVGYAEGYYRVTCEQSRSTS